MSQLNEWAQLIVGVLTAVSLGVGGWLALRKWLRGWVRGVAEDSREAARQLTTSNGTTVAQYVEQTNKAVAEATALAQTNAARIEAVAAVAEMTSRRLDDHLLRGHDKPI